MATDARADTLARIELAWPRLSVDVQLSIAHIADAIARHAPRPLRGDVGPWLTAASASRYLDFMDCRDPVDAFRRFAKRTGLVARARRGDVPLFHRSDLDRAVIVVTEKGKR